MRGTKAKAAPLSKGAQFPAPAWMSERQQAIWNEAVSSAPAGLLSASDRGVLTVYVIAADGLIEAAKKVSEYGAVVKSPKSETPMQSPYESIKNKQAEIMMRAASELGFTPISRSRLIKLDADAPKILTDEPLGKKAQAAKDALVAQNGTSWEDLLPPSATPQ